ncbi:MAG: sigma 54-interacting transcriptional regulator [Pseudomonadota bacterium]
MDISKYWKTIIDTLPDGLIVVDTAGVIQAANPAAEKLTGYTIAELLGSSCRILNCTGCKIVGVGRGKDFCKLFTVGQSRGKECVISRRDNRLVHIHKSATLLRGPDGEVAGAIETLTDVSELIRKQQEIESLRKTLQLEEGYHGLLGKSPAMERLFALIESVAPSNAPVLIQGQSGTGKELVARAIHEAGARKEGPFVKVNCAALNESLLESELFGHVKGAYTGADRDRIGRFEAAHGGTIFLDEVGDIPLSTQVKLLRVLEEKEIERVGDHKPVPVDVRIVSATHRNLEESVTKGEFREDLFFRINVFPLYCPSLGERREDIPIIVQNFIERNSQKGIKKIIGLTADAMSLLLSHTWPGNVRELRNAIEYAFVLCPGGYIDVTHMPPKISGAGGNAVCFIPPNGDFREEKARLEQVLRQVGWNQSEAGRLLGVSRVTVWKRIKKYGIRLPNDL